MFFFYHSHLWGTSQRLSEQKVESESSPPVIRPTCDATVPRCQLLSPASEAYLDRAHSVAHARVLVHSVLVVGYSKLPALDSTSGRTAAQLTQENQCS